MPELVLLALIFLTGFTIWISYRERRELVDRLMAKDLQDYKVNSQPVEETEVEEENPDLVDLDEAGDVILQDMEDKRG